MGGRTCLYIYRVWSLQTNVNVHVCDTLHTLRHRGVGILRVTRWATTEETGRKHGFGGDENMAMKISNTWAVTEIANFVCLSVWVRLCSWVSLTSMYVWDPVKYDMHWINAKGAGRHQAKIFPLKKICLAIVKIIRIFFY